MSNILIYILFVFMIFMSIQNFKILKNAKKGKGYIEAASAVFKEEVDAKEKLEKFVNDEKSDAMYLSKASLIETWFELKEKGTCDSLNKYDTSLLFKTNNKLDDKQIDINADSFIWSILDMARSKNIGKEEYIDKFVESYSSVDFADRMEYQLVLHFAKFLKGDEDTSFFKTISQASEEGLKYDKRLVGIYRRIASLCLDIKGEELDDYSKEDLKTFAQSAVGKLLMCELNVFEKYDVVEEVEEKEEENKEE